MTTYFGTILWEITCIRIRQRRILKALKDNGILDWDGNVSTSDKDADILFQELRKAFDADNSGQGSGAPTI